MNKAGRELRAMRTRDAGRPLTGDEGFSQMWERDKKRRKKILLVQTHRTFGSQSIGDPAQYWAHKIKRMMRPIQRAPVNVYNGTGTLIAIVQTDPITGKYSRQSIP